MQRPCEECGKATEEPRLLCDDCHWEMCLVRERLTEAELDWSYWQKYMEDLWRR